MLYLTNAPLVSSSLHDLVKVIVFPRHERANSPGQSGSYRLASNRPPRTMANLKMARPATYKSPATAASAGAGTEGHAGSSGQASNVSPQT